MKTETHLIEVIRETAMLAAGSRYECPPPLRGRYHITGSISVPVENCKCFAVTIAETPDGPVRPVRRLNRRTRP